MTTRAIAFLVLSGGVSMGCRGPSATVHHGAAGAAFVAVVNGDGVDSSTVAGIARERGVAVPAALDVAVSDAVFAAAGRERAGRAATRQAERSALARSVLESLAEEALSDGPPTDAEVNEMTAERWWDLDQPELLRTSHAVVLVKNPEDDLAARALADRVAAKVKGISDPAAFRAAATSVSAPPLEIRVEDLDPVARDGRVVDLDAPPPPGSKMGEFAADFVKAAYTIPRVGAQSPVVRTKFGYHVILVTEKIPEHRVPFEARRRLLALAIYQRRAAKRRDALLQALRKKDRVDVERSALDTAALLKARE